MSGPLVSVLMPTFEQARFIEDAVTSLRAQSLQDWELVIVDDGSRDDTPHVVSGFATDPRVRSHRAQINRGLGATLNVALDRAVGEFVAYLPSDDLYDPDHLASLVRCIEHTGAHLVCAGVRVDGEEERDVPEAFGLRLVQAMHRRTLRRWLERDRIETDDLERLFFSSLRSDGPTAATGCVTCEWRQHAGQRHRAIRESLDGGLNVFRARYRVSSPLRFASSDSWPVDEVGLYRRFRGPDSQNADGLKILVVGELGYNPERVLAFEERRHRLYGLWIENPLPFSAVGPLPFGATRDLAASRWRDAIREVRPDVVYGLLNWRAVPLAHDVMSARLGVPFVWHFKESPMRCRTRGTWPQLVDLCARADAQLMTTELERNYLSAVGGVESERSLVMDGDLPKAEWFTTDTAERLSQRDGDLHTVVLGRPIGFDARLVQALAAARIHVHLYGLVRGKGPTGAWMSWLDDALRVARGYVHVHPHVDQRRWVHEFSRYDAGWLHVFDSTNRGDPRALTWDDMNLPARLPTLAAAGVPLLVRDSPDSTVAVRDLVARMDIGVVYRDVDDLRSKLRDDEAMERRRNTLWARRMEFTFDHHVDRLIQLFRDVAA